MRLKKSKQTFKNGEKKCKVHGLHVHALCTLKVFECFLWPKHWYVIISNSKYGIFPFQKLRSKRYILQTVGHISVTSGFLSLYTIRIKFLIQVILCLGLYWEGNLPRQLYNLWKGWDKEIKELSIIKVSRFYLVDIAIDESNYF